MTEKALRTTFLLGSLVFLVLLIAMTVDSLRKVNAGRTPAVTAQVAAGKEVWSRKNCNDCHTILGIGGYYAPDLTKVADARDAAWLRRFLADPQGAKPGTTMPNQRLAEADVTNLIAFFDWVRRIDTNGWPPRPLAQLGVSVAGRPDAPAAFQNKGCSGCHAVDGRGANGPGPDLSHLGTTPVGGLANDSAFLARFLDDPAAAKPGTLMPKLPLTPAERDILVHYLLALK
ncbi:MAG: cytochrome c [Gemmatimonadales bacterium]|jgi:nitric oxide reductase subunit C